MNFQHRLHFKNNCTFSGNLKDIIAYFETCKQTGNMLLKILRSKRNYSLFKNFWVPFFWSELIFFFNYYECLSSVSFWSKNWYKGCFIRSCLMTDNILHTYFSELLGKYWQYCNETCCEVLLNVAYQKIVLLNLTLTEASYMIYKS